VADAWGGHWGTTWAVSWTSSGTPTPPVVTQAQQLAGRGLSHAAWREFAEYKEALRLLKAEAKKKKPKRLEQAVAALESVSVAPPVEEQILDLKSVIASNQVAIDALAALIRRLEDDEDEEDIEFLLLS
jgi:hypothetical protein